VKIKFKNYDDRVLPEMGAKIAFLAPGSDESPARAKSLLTIPVTGGEQEWSASRVSSQGLIGLPRFPWFWESEWETWLRSRKA